MHPLHDETALPSMNDGNNIIFHRVGNTERQTTRVLARLERLPAPFLEGDFVVWFEPMIIFSLFDRQRYNSSFIKRK